MQLVQSLSKAEHILRLAGCFSRKVEITSMGFVIVFSNADIFLSLRIKMFHNLYIYHVQLETIFYISFISRSTSGGRWTKRLAPL